MPLPAIPGASPGMNFNTSFSDITNALGDLVGRNSDVAVNSNTSANTEGTTEQTISKEGMDYLLKSILGSTQGLAAVAQGEKSSGLYDSSTGSLLVSDLIARSAGEVAARNITTKNKSNTNQTTNQNQDTSQQGLLSNIGGQVRGGLSSLGHALGF